MKVKEAFSVLGLQEGASQDEIKKAYRKLSKIWHPDINKSPEAENKFKTINDAFEVCKTGKSSDIEDRHYQQQSSPFNPFSGFNPFGGGFQRQHHIEVPDDIEISVNISFKESILGVKKDISFNRNAKCQTCNGKGEKPINNNCKKCGGSGQTTNRRGNMIFVTTCSDCHGNISSEDCSTCSATGTLNAEVSIQISIPPGIENDSVLRLQGIGHYSGSSFLGMGDAYEDVFCKVNVSKDKDLSLDDKDVVCNITIPLIDALRGCQKVVPTIDGDKEISIPNRARNLEEVIIPNLGVARKGNQRVILNVEYPNDLSLLINTLQEIEK